MKIFNSLNTNEGLSLALGFFDGIHLGHRAVIESAVNFAKQNNTKSAVITFQEHPCCYFYDLKPKYIIQRGDKIKYLEEMGVDYLYFIKFDEDVSKMTGEEYLRNIIIKNFAPSAISTGFNHKFGAEKSANSKFLRDKQEEYNYKYFEIPPVNYKNTIISSTEIREKLSMGRIEQVNDMLGYHYGFEETVKTGQQIGRTIGFSTANIDYPEHLVNIGFGVYQVEIEYKGEKYKGLANFGCKPTLTKNSNPILEVHILNFDEMIYYEKIRVSFLKRIRNEMKFNSVGELKEQIEKDIQQIL